MYSADIGRAIKESFISFLVYLFILFMLICGLLVYILTDNSVCNKSTLTQNYMVSSTEENYNILIEHIRNCDHCTKDVPCDHCKGKGKIYIKDIDYPLVLPIDYNLDYIECRDCNGGGILFLE